MHETCTSVGVRGVDVCEHMTIYGLRSTMITLLMDAGFTAAAVVRCTGHKSVDSLRSYNTLLNNTGMCQQAAVLGSPAKKQKTLSHDNEINPLIINEILQHILTRLRFPPLSVISFPICRHLIASSAFESKIIFISSSCFHTTSLFDSL